MFNKDFYPTARIIIETMLQGVDLKGKTVLEPSAGAGHIIDYLKEHGANVIACENNLELSKIAAEKADRFLKPDFMEVNETEVSHIDMIVANPPFSDDEKHILHMWEIAPEGCQIISLCNWETIDNTYTRNRAKLARLINEDGISQNLGQVFKEAERKTYANIGLVKLFKPATGDNEFFGYFDLSEEYEEEQGEGLMKHSEIKEIVQRYVGAVKMFDSVINSTDAINDLISPIAYSSNITFGAFQRTGSYNSVINRDTFKKELQKSAWRSVFKKLDMDRFLTKSVMKDINNFVEKQVNVPFTVNNIYKMMEMIIGTQKQRMERVIVEAFDNITKHHDNNRFQLEGWKTNSEYRVNKKFIKGSYDFNVDTFSGNAEPSYTSNQGYFMDDLTKALCHVTGISYKDCLQWEPFLRNWQKYDRPYRYPHPKKPGEFYEGTREDSKAMGREFGKWHEFNFVRFKVYKKRTMHVEFLDDKVWDAFNVIACKAKGFQLASKFTSDFRQKSTDIQTI